MTLPTITVYSSFPLLQNAHSGWFILPLSVTPQDSTYAHVSLREERELPRYPHGFRTWFLMIMPALRSPSLGCFAVGCLCQCCQERFLALEGTSWLPSAMDSAQPEPTPPPESHWAHSKPWAWSPWCCEALLGQCLILPTCLSPAVAPGSARASPAFALGAISRQFLPGVHLKRSFEITGRDNATTEILIGCVSHTLFLPT